MRLARRISDLNLDRTKSLALVPTMGAFHEGHLALIRKAKGLAEVVAVSLFVNPTQFSPSEDFKKYPRDEQRDLDLAASCGVDLVFAPPLDEMYGDDLTRIHVSGVGDHWEGPLRPGHFDGVATVVAKLFNIIRADVAVFGLKDIQQCAVIRQMVKDLNFPVRLEFIETIREPDGLAMSSRNAYLSTDDRAIAPKLHEEVLSAVSMIKEGSDILDVLALSRVALERAGFQVQYLHIVDPITMLSTSEVDENSRLIAAVKLGGTRLIDNIHF